jgi:nucleoside-diphosphate-sugar epimerase
MKHILIIGGTGIVGTAMAQVAHARGYEVTCLAENQKQELPQGIEFVRANKHAKDFVKIAHELKKVHSGWDVLVDILSYTAKDAKLTYENFKDCCKHLFVISTTLVYDRFGQKFGYERIQTEHPLAKKGVQGGYVDHKLEMEEFWHNRKDCSWTILRPYHILGTGSWLGCIPPHNRDPALVELIDQEEIIRLSDGGRIPINIVHPKDLGEIIVRAAGKRKTLHKCYNAVNPAEIVAREYYEEIARQLGKKLRIHSEPSEHAWHFEHEWQLTTLPHLYDVSDLKRDIGYVPSTPLAKCIEDSLQNQPAEKPNKRLTDVHRKMNLKPEPDVHPFYRDAYYARTS